MSQNKLNSNNVFCPITFEQYETELEKNTAFLKLGIKRFVASLGSGRGNEIFNSYKKGFSKSPLNEKRSRQLIQSLTDDLMRYASYHSIKDNKYHYKMRENDASFSIAEPVRASYFTKWIMTFKPLSLYDLANLKSNKFSEFETRVLNSCNEYLALHIADAIMDIKDSKGTDVSIFNILGDLEMDVFLYSP